MKRTLASLAVALLFLIGLAIYLVWQGIPLLLAGAVRLVPISWEDRMGQAVVDGITRNESVCTDAPTRELVTKVLARLEESMPKTPYRFDVQVVRNPLVNAMAAPGGHIIVYSGLIERMDNAEQLAAVLAHEMQHVVQRHSMKGMVRAIGLQAFLSLVLGDTGIIGDLAGNLTALQFMRSDEESADDAALQTILRAGIAPAEMQKAFGNLARSEKSGSFEGSFKYLSTHPPLAERIERVRVNSVGWSGLSRKIGVTKSVPCSTTTKSP